MQMHVRKLNVWQKAMDIAKNTYRLTAAFPQSEQFGLVSQMRRSAVSIPSNIAEGSQRESDKDFAHFLSIAKGSLAELETQFLLAQSLSYIPEEDTTTILKEIGEVDRMLHAFRSKLHS